MSAFLISFVIWAVLHSITAAQWFKALVRKGMGERPYHGFYRLAYTLFSAASFLPVLYFYWLLPDQLLWSVPAPWSWLMMAGQLVGLIGLTVAVLQANGLAFVGLQQALDYLSGQQDLDKAGLGEELVTHGLFAYMRHPLYTFSLMVLWLMPTVTRNYLIFVLLSTAYFIIGSIFEERRLEADFGEAYVAYKARVPRFFPRYEIRNTID